MSFSVSEIFKPGNLIHIQFSDQLGQIKDCTAIIKNIMRSLNEEKFFLEFQEQEIASGIHQGSELTIGFRNKGGEIHRFGTYVIEQEFSGEKPLILAKPVAVDYTSFRRYFRVDVELPFRYIWSDQQCQGKVINLSGCGLLAQIELNPEITLGTSIDFEFLLPNNSRPTRLNGRVVRIELIGNPIHHGIALDFANIDKYDQTEIVVFLAKQLYAKNG